MKTFLLFYENLTTGLDLRGGSRRCEIPKLSVAQIEHFLDAQPLLIGDRIENSHYSLKRREIRFLEDTTSNRITK